MNDTVQVQVQEFINAVLKLEKGYKSDKYGLEVGAQLSLGINIFPTL